MMGISDGQGLPGGHVGQNDAYFIPQDVVCVLIPALGTLLQYNIVSVYRS